MYSRWYRKLTTVPSTTCDRCLSLHNLQRQLEDIRLLYNNLNQRLVRLELENKVDNKVTNNLNKSLKITTK